MDRSKNRKAKMEETPEVIEKTEIIEPEVAELYPEVAKDKDNTETQENHKMVREETNDKIETDQVQPEIQPEVQPEEIDEKIQSEEKPEPDSNETEPELKKEQITVARVDPVQGTKKNQVQLKFNYKHSCNDIHPSQGSIRIHFSRR